MSVNGYTTYKITGRLVVNGVNFECVRANVAFELNGVPRAMFMVAVGRGTGQLTPAAIHSAQFSIQVPIQFYCTMQYLDGVGETFANPNGNDPPTYSSIPIGEFLLFDGYLTGINWSKSRQQEHAILQAKHWLLDMDYSSSLSDSSHPLNPSQFTYRASHILPGTGLSQSWIPLTDQGLITPDILASDFWGDGLAMWLKALTAMDLINTDELSFLGGLGGANTTAAKALARFTTTGGNYVPLAMDFGGGDAPSIAAAIWDDIQMETYDSFARVTLWDKLVGDFASRYMFAVVPRISDALVIPYVPGLQSTWSQTLEASDYAMLNASAELMRLLRGVGVFAGIKSRTGADMREPGEDPARLGIGGWFGPSDINSGMIMLKQGPRWLNNIVATDRYSEFSSGAGANPISTAMHPGAGTDGNGPPTPASLKASSKSLLDAFANSLYVYEQLKLRQLELSGKVRFDIAPGSTVKIGTTGDPYIAQNTETQTLIADVVRVAFLIDSEAGRANTDFHLAHLRTETENQSPSFSVPSHPFWKNPWPGCGLMGMFDKQPAAAAPVPNP